MWDGCGVSFKGCTLSSPHWDKNQILGHRTKEVESLCLTLKTNGVHQVLQEY